MKRTPVIITLAAMAALAVTGTALAATRDDRPSALTGLGSAVATTDPTAPATPTDATSTPDDDATASPDDDRTATPTPDSSTTSPAAPAGGGLDADEASRIALDRVGGGTVTEIESELEHGAKTWKVEVVRDGVEHDIYVDRTNGTIIKADSDRDDDDRDDDDRDDDDRDDDDRDDDDDDDHDRDDD
ncbi:PepSY domain-containing protein [Asanoa siamensis]|uniref:PepSY domain-containing protein n=1 Tax=Asanoa siamensis TaxID=926357 RepID=A0ABQ4CH93_9ACTN|nr:PepSY domain-containing protein [Asanoa siamensis]GIF70637.1 hypothetical protein Asi02nite_01550 [Asanoa siamensis]